MALTGTYSFRGFAVPGAYVQARGMILSDKDRGMGRAIVWTSQVERQNPDSQPLDVINFQFQLNELSTPIYDAAYAALKAMPQFAGFSDC